MHVRDAELASHAERLLTASQVGYRDLALAFEESTATAAEVLVGGTSFFPRMLEDIGSATSSVHIVQFGFRPGAVGDRFAEALLAKTRDGVPCGWSSTGTAPTRSAGRRSSTTGWRPAACRRAWRAARRRAGPSGRSARATARCSWKLRTLGHIDHRKVLVIDGRIGWVGGAGVEDHFEDGRFHDLFLRLEGPVVSQLQLVVLASLRSLGGTVPVEELPSLFPAHAGGDGAPAVVLHNAPGRFRPITDAIAELLESARETLDVVNPYVTDRGMIKRIERAAQRGARVRLFVPGNPNNWACGLAERFHHGGLLEAGVEILEYPQMLHAKAFVRDGEDVLAGTCNLEAWSLKRFFEIDVRVRSAELARQFEERFSAPAVAVSGPGRPRAGSSSARKRRRFAALSPFL